MDGLEVSMNLKNSDSSDSGKLDDGIRTIDEVSDSNGSVQFHKITGKHTQSDETNEGMAWSQESTTGQRHSTSSKEVSGFGAGSVLGFRCGA